MDEHRSTDARLAVVELKCKQNERALRETLNEIRTLPSEIKKMIFEQFTNHQVFHNALDRRDESQAEMIGKLVKRITQIEILVVKIKANWKLVAASFSIVIALLVWVFQRGVEAVFLK